MEPVFHKSSTGEDFGLSTARGNRRVIPVVRSVHAEAARREGSPQRAEVRPVEAVRIRLDPCIARSEDW